jgi:hypothetical protein
VRAPLDIEDLRLSASAVEPLLATRTVYLMTTPPAARARCTVFRRDPDCAYWFEDFLSSMETPRRTGVSDTPVIATASLGTPITAAIEP